MAKSALKNRRVMWEVGVGPLLPEVVQLTKPGKYKECRIGPRTENEPVS